jgi:hypothetical protein
MEAVVDDFGMGKLLVNDGAVGSIAVDANGAVTRLLSGVELGEEGQEALLFISKGWALLVVAPHAEDFDAVLGGIHLVNEAVLEIDPAGIRTG